MIIGMKIFLYDHIGTRLYGIANLVLILIEIYTVTFRKILQY